MSDEAGRILVADADPTNRVTLSRQLERLGHSVAEAEDGRRALELLAEQAFDAVFLAVLMPELDGVEVLSRIKGDAALREVPVIVISTPDDLDSAARLVERGAEDHLSAPFDPVFLEARLGAGLRRKRLRELERDYARQEATLQQNDKLATLGRLSAGLAHELNNPAAAALRGVEQLQSALEHHLATHLALDALDLSDAQVASLSELFGVIRSCKEAVGALEPLERGDREDELAAWLDDHDVGDAWELTPTLVSLGYDRDELERLGAGFDGAGLPLVLTWLVSGLTVFNVLDEIGEGTGRIAEIVKALKSYSYLDEAPLQEVDVREGLDSTLLMFRSRLRQGVNVRRHYAEDLPAIEAYEGELNQVWTNLIDNAVSAMEGRGELSLHARREGDRVVVEIVDTGPGIPEGVQASIFEPFFTTKPPGEGTGLGLNISHNIVVGKHHGEITVDSKPGKTSFQVRLPLSPEKV